jgi:hypothetical protein
MLGGEFPEHPKGCLSWPGPAFSCAQCSLRRAGSTFDCLTVESALAVEGYAEAFEVFKDDRLRAGIRAICRKHWRHAQAEANDNRPSLEDGRTAR